MSAAPHGQSHPARSRTRIGSDDARTWVRKLRLGNPYAKSILMAVANYMNEDGAAWPGLATLSQDTDIAEDTIAKRLRWCEGIGAVVLLRCWVDENGRRNLDSRCKGRPTSSEIRFLFDADPEEIAEAAAAATDPRPLRGAALSNASPRPDGEQSQEISDRHGREQNSVSTQVAPEQPPPGAARREEEEESKKDSPLPPKGGDGHEIGVGSEASEEQSHDTWPEFERAWSEPILRQSLARQVWAALSPSERLTAIKAGKGYVVWRRSQKRPPNVINAHTFLKESAAWAGFIALAPPDPKPAAPPKPRHILTSGEAQFAAYALARAIARQPPIRSDVVTFIGDVPNGADGLSALVNFKPDTYEVDQSGWTVAAKGSPRYVAWCERVKEWIGAWPEDHRYWLDTNNNIVATASEAEKRPSGLPKSIDGLLMPPLDWPPPKGSDSHSLTK